jgi:hypothetical protein
MSNLSIRGINSDLATKLKQQAQASGKSVNQLVLDVLKEHTGQHKKKAFHAGISRFGFSFWAMDRRRI